MNAIEYTIHEQAGDIARNPRVSLVGKQAKRVTRSIEDEGRRHGSCGLLGQHPWLGITVHNVVPNTEADIMTKQLCENCHEQEADHGQYGGVLACNGQVYSDADSGL